MTGYDYSIRPTLLRITLSPGVVKNVQESEIETLTGLLLEGRPVHTGVAIYHRHQAKPKPGQKLQKTILQSFNRPGVNLWGH